MKEIFNIKVYLLLGVIVVGTLIIGSALFAFLPPFLKPSSPIILVNSNVFEGQKCMTIFSNGTVRCEGYHFTPSYKEITIKKGYVSEEEIERLLELFLNLANRESHLALAGEEVYGVEHIYDVGLGNVVISCLPLNKTLEVHFSRSERLAEEETITLTAEEILTSIDNIYREAEVVETLKEMNLNFVGVIETRCEGATNEELGVQMYNVNWFISVAANP